MQVSSVSFEESGLFPSLFLDYIHGDGKLRPFYAYPPSPDAFQRAIEDRKAGNVNRQVLASVLKRQYQGVDKTPEDVINSLLSEDTFTVCTGHQLCLFTGPLYFLYKIVTTINLAEELKKKYPRFNFVPLYWMASEDHDLDEINHVVLFGKKISWETAERERGSPVGRISTAGLAEVAQELKLVLGSSPHAGELLRLFTRAYVDNGDMASATRWLVNELFGEYGLLVIDGDEKELKQSLKPVIENDIFVKENYRLVLETARGLSEYSYKVQVNPRPLNFFYFSGNKRERIEEKDGAYQVLNTRVSFSASGLRKEIEDHPERFSPNVVTRPLYQQLILPNLAYIGGPNELSYWLEYKSMFDHNGIRFPILVPRASALFVDRVSAEKLKKLKVSVQELFSNTDELINRFVTQHASAVAGFQDEEQELRNIYAGIGKKAAASDPTLAPAVEAELQKQLNFLKAMAARLHRAEKQKQETSLSQLRKLKEKLFPEGSFQERHENFSAPCLALGPQFFQMLKENLKPFENKIVLFMDV